MDNKLVVITGTGDAFIDRVDMEATTAWYAARNNDPVVAWRDMSHKRLKLARNHLDIQVPVIAAVTSS